MQANGVPNPAGTTHFALTYGDLHFYRQNQYTRLNQVSEEWQTLTSWSEWDTRKEKWIDVGDGFSSRLLKPIADLSLEVPGGGGFGPG